MVRILSCSAWNSACSHTHTHIRTHTRTHASRVMYALRLYKQSLKLWRQLACKYQSHLCGLLLFLLLDCFLFCLPLCDLVAKVPAGTRAQNALASHTVHHALMHAALTRLSAESLCDGLIMLPLGLTLDAMALRSTPTGHQG